MILVTRSEAEDNRRESEEERKIPVFTFYKYFACHFLPHLCYWLFCAGLFGKKFSSYLHTFPSSDNWNKLEPLFSPLQHSSHFGVKHI